MYGAAFLLQGAIKMAVIRVNKTRDYTVMSNYHLKDKKLSLKAKGLLSQMLSLPDDWDYSINGLVAICKEKKTSIVSALDELKEHGYLTVTKLMPNQTQSGRIEYVYDVYEQPEKQDTEKQGIENLGLENLGIEKQGIENQPQLNTNILNTKELNTNKLNTKDIGACAHRAQKVSERPKRKRFAPPTVEDVEKYCNERNNGIDAQHFIDYYETRGWELSKGRKVKDWKACVRTWERNSYSSDSSRKQTEPAPKEKKMLPPLGQDYYKDGKFDLEGYNAACNKYNEWLNSRS